MADAKTHRFTPTAEVEVSFELRGPAPRGAVVRFARNRVTLSASRSGALALQRKGARTRRLAGTGRVSVVLAGDDGHATLAVGGRTARLTGTFVAEHAVRAHVGKSVRALTIRPGRPAAERATAPAPSPTRTVSPAPTPARSAVVSPTPTPSPTPAPSPSPSPTPAPSPSPSPTPAPSPSPSPTPAPSPSPTPTPAPSPTPAPVPTPLFAPDSVWNKPVPANAALDPESPVLVKKLSDTVKDGFVAGRASWIQTTTGSTPLYIAPAGAPTVRVTLDAGAWATSLQTALNAVPMPANAVPATGIDAQMTIYQPSTNKLWELFKASKKADGWHASYGGAISGVTSYPGYYSGTSWLGLSYWYWGATASSLPMIGGTMLLKELKAGVIPHALAMNIPYARKKIHSWPAQRTDGTSPDPQAIPEGARFRLDPTLDLSKLTLPPMTRMMAVAAQRYGIVVRDQTGWAVALFGEDPTPTGANPYSGSTGYFRGRPPSEIMNAFPWDRLQLLQMELQQR